MKITLLSEASASQKGSTLAETLVSMAIAVTAIAGTVNGYVLSAQRAEWSAYSLAAQSLANQQIEFTRAAKWDTLAFPIQDQVVATNFPIAINILDVPISGTNTVYATNYTSIVSISANPPLKMVRVDCVWRFFNRGVYTNTVITYRAPDQ